MKITNPFSKGRFSRKENFERALTKKLAILKPYLLERDDKHDVLTSLYHGFRRPFIFNKNVSIPNDVEVSLLSVTIADLIPIEELSEIRDGIKKMLKLYRPNFNFFNDPKHVDNFYNEITSSVHGTRWSDLGNIQFDEKTSIGKYITHVNIQASQMSSSIIVMHYRLSLSDTFTSNFHQIINSDVNGETVFRPNFKHIFRYWGSSTYSPEQVKRRQLEDSILELKWMFLKEINSHIPSFFFNNKLVPPGILIYKIKQEFCPIKHDKDRDSFWESIELPQKHHPFYHDISENGAWQLHIDAYSHGLDESVRICCNSEIQLKLMNDVDSEIIHSVDYFAREALPLLALRRYALFMSKQIAAFRINIFRAINNTKIKYKKILRQRLTIQQNGLMLERINNELNQREYERKKADLIDAFYKWEPADKQYGHGTWVENVVETTQRLVNDTYKHFETLNKTIDDTVQILTIQTNFSLQRKTVMLTIVTILLALVALYLTYYQITQETPKDLLEHIMKLL